MRYSPPAALWSLWRPLALPALRTSGSALRSTKRRGRYSRPARGRLYARTHDGATPTDTLVTGNWLNAPHRYRIEWNTSSINFLIDGVVVATHAAAIAANMRPIVSDFNTGGDAIAVNWMRLSPYAAAGTFTSRVLDAGAATSWGSAMWTAVTPANTAVAVSARFGDTPVPDGTWTGFST